MITRIELDKQDMRDIIAEKFDVLPDFVQVTIKEECVGYGLDEHTVHVPVCYIEK